ncbi:hypothetical protein E3U23_13270 [Erythrobacter litoralis]|uniref:hypothetical protein n=1 Tax=Erythrobacter litoralis TaxID=39960 RepID=UPI0024361429|nr:hypothetical protein [Erythrobacter litoralis]MDG6080159.1 hypothetical protein [Erythrobacter litoralis]
MNFILTTLIVIGAIVDAMLGLGFLFDPAGSGGEFGLLSDGPAGLSSMRADFTAFFLVSAACMSWGGWRRRGGVLLVPLALFGVAFVGRLINLIVVGPYDLWQMPMLVELAHIIVLAIAVRRWAAPAANLTSRV